MEADIQPGDYVLHNQQEWQVRHVLTDRHGETRYCLLNKYQYLTGIRPRDCTLVRRKDEPEPSTHPYTYVTAMDNWRVGDEVEMHGERHTVSGLCVDTNGSLHIYVTNPHMGAHEAHGALRLLRRADHDDEGEAA